MTWHHLQTFLWLRWRLVLNHSRRHGAVSLALFFIFKVVFALSALAALIIGFLLGATSLPNRPPEVAMLTFAGVIVAYLFFTVIGIIVELQRAEMLSLDKFLHLPMTLSGAFLINYLGSSMNLSALVFFSGMLGLSLGLSIESDGGAAFTLPLFVVVFFLMMTALIYQFRGWLASMLANPRRRQTMIVIITMAFLLVMMSPSLPGIVSMYRHKAEADANAPAVTVNAGDKSVERRARRNQRRQPMTPDEVFKLQSRARFASAILPPGWLAYGVVNTLEGRIIPALTCLFGMGLIGAWSLRRSYQTTLRLYRGEFSAGHGSKQRAASQVQARPRTRPVNGRRAHAGLRLPWVPERAYAVCVASFRYLLRIPEMKLTLLSPLIMLLVFGGISGSGKAEIAEYPGALRALGFAALMLLMSILYLQTNQFAYDRSGFRAFVLSPASRRDVLLGKNLAFFPFGAGLMVLAIGLCQWLAPLRPDHLAAVSLQIIPIFLWFCVAGNAMSIYLPLVVKPGTAMPATGQSLKLLLRFLATLASLAPLTLLVLPLGIEYLMHLMAWGEGFPTFLVLVLIQTALMIWLYLVILDRQAEWLHRREQEILAVVTTKAE